MRKGFLFWSGIILGVAFIAGLLVFFGHEPEVRDLMTAIPEPGGDQPYMFTLNDGNLFTAGHHEFFGGVDEKTSSLYPLYESFSRLASKAEKVAVLAIWDQDRVRLMASMKMPFEDLQALSAGNLPDTWKDIRDVKLEKKSDGVFLFAPPAIREPMLVKRDGGLLLVSNSLQDLSLMTEVLAGNVNAMELEGSPLFRKHNNFIKLHDAGLISQVALLYGIPTKTGNISFHGRWEGTEHKGEMLWQITGLEEVFPKDLLSLLTPVEWTTPMILPEPVLLAVGLNAPGLSREQYDELDVFQLAEDYEMTSEDLMMLLKGPMAVSVSGESKFILFKVPGLLVQFQGRGKAGKDFIGKFWSSRWSAFIPAISPVEGFERGGSAGLPLSLLGVANDDLAVLGFLEASKAREFHLPGKVVHALKKSSDRALLWCLIDGPGLSDALQRVAQAGEIAEKIGSDLGGRAADIIDTARKLEKLGRLSLVMTDIGNGILQWDGSSL